MPETVSQTEEENILSDAPNPMANLQNSSHLYMLQSVSDEDSFYD
jgi:hypothetical protein